MKLQSIFPSGMKSKFLANLERRLPACSVRKNDQVHYAMHKNSHYYSEKNFLIKMNSYFKLNKTSFRDYNFTGYMIIKYQLIITKLAFVRLNNYLAKKITKSKLKYQEI